MSTSTENYEPYTIEFCKHFEQEAKKIEDKDKQRIIKILLRMNPYFDFEDLIRYKLI